MLTIILINKGYPETIITVQKQFTTPYLLTYTIRNAIKLNHKEYVYTQNFWEWLLYMYIQGVPGGNVNILGGHCIGHSKQKKCMCTCGL